MKFSKIAIGIAVLAGVAGHIPSSQAEELISKVDSSLIEQKQVGELINRKIQGELIAASNRVQATIQEIVLVSTYRPGDPPNIVYRIGNFDTAVSDLQVFWAIPYNKPILDRTRPGRPEVRLVNVEPNVNAIARSTSSQGIPTQEIQDKSSGSSVALLKVRYVNVIPE